MDISMVKTAVVKSTDAAKSMIEAIETYGVKLSELEAYVALLESKRDELVRVEAKLDLMRSDLGTVQHQYHEAKAKFDAFKASLG